uniref:Uncharacterized protein n=1 Tax=Arundo donax TaxID=35708 RepID=A0A0A9AT80_ARUDO
MTVQRSLQSTVVTCESNSERQHVHKGASATFFHKFVDLAYDTYTHIAGKIIFHSNLFHDHFRKTSKQALKAMETIKMLT